MQRITAIGQAIEKYNAVHGRLPQRLTDLAPNYVSATILTDPWGNRYKYLQRPERYLVFSNNGKTDTDLLLSRAVDSTITAPSTPTDTGGIQLLP
jgi:hypothetical protein